MSTLAALSACRNWPGFARINEKNAFLEVILIRSTAVDFGRKLVSFSIVEQQVAWLEFVCHSFDENVVNDCPEMASINNAANAIWP